MICRPEEYLVINWSEGEVMGSASTEGQARTQVEKCELRPGRVLVVAKVVAVSVVERKWLPK